jgi:hypothetical protein
VRRELKPLDLKDLQLRLAETIERKKLDDPRELRKTVEDLKRQLASRPKEQVEKIVEKIVERPAIDAKTLKETEGIVERLEREGAKQIEAGNRLVEAAKLMAAALRATAQPVRPVPIVRPVMTVPQPPRRAHAAHRCQRRKDRQGRTADPHGAKPTDDQRYPIIPSARGSIPAGRARRACRCRAGHLHPAPDRPHAHAARRRHRATRAGRASWQARTRRDGADVRICDRGGARAQREAQRPVDGGTKRGAVSVRGAVVVVLRNEITCCEH